VVNKKEFSGLIFETSIIKENNELKSAKHLELYLVYHINVQLVNILIIIVINIRKIAAAYMLNISDHFL